MSHEELTRCIQAYGRDIYSFCRKLTCSYQEADDLYQDTFLKLLELKDKVDVEYNPKSYLLSVCINLWRNSRRKKAWRQRIAGTEMSVQDEAVPEIADGSASVEEQIISCEERRLVRAAVDALPEKYRIPILLFYMENEKLSEISEILGVPEGTVKSRLYRAKKLLEEKLEVLNEERCG